jgi:hypothetical protein
MVSFMKNVKLLFLIIVVSIKIIPQNTQTCDINLLGRFLPTGEATSVCYYSNYVFVGNLYEAIDIIDISNPSYLG